MNATAAAIAERLEASFAARGFAEPGVDALRADAGVSLRTLYRHFPSREAMVIGALEHRHRSYLAYLTAGMPEGPGRAPVLHVFERLGAWLAERAPKGCLFVGALAAHPESKAVRETVARHKRETRQLIARSLRRAAPGAPRASVDALADGLFVVHEGQTALAATRGGRAATAAALALAAAWLAREGIP